jgi:hypothetical protein
MSKLSSLKYDFIIYTSLFVAFVCAIASCISPSSAVSEQPVEQQEIEITEPEIAEPENLRTVDKYSVAQKALDLIIDQGKTDGVITSDMMNTWEAYSVKKMTYKKEIMEGYYQYEVEIKITGTTPLIPNDNNIIVSKNTEYTTIRVYMNIHYSKVRNGYLVKSIDLPSQN